MTNKPIGSVVIPRRVLDRVWDKVEQRGPDECWPWKMSVGSHGYGQIGWSKAGEDRGMTTAHRAVWTALYGPIPSGMVVDHICYVRTCCNPAHLRVLTHAENSRLTRRHLSDMCQRGLHLREPGRKTCRLCANASQKAWRARQKEDQP